VWTSASKGYYYEFLLLKLFKGWFQTLGGFADQSMKSPEFKNKCPECKICEKMASSQRILVVLINKTAFSIKI